MQHPAERSEKKRFLSDLFGRPESLPLLLFILFFVVLGAADPELRSAKYVFDPPWLLFTLNTVFITGLCLLIAWLCFRSFLRGGFLNVLLLGCGVLTFGLSSFVAGWLIRPPYGPNYTVTIHNIGVLLHGRSLLPEFPVHGIWILDGDRKAQGPYRVMAYAAVFGVGVILTAATLLDSSRPFLSSGKAPRSSARLSSLSPLRFLPLPPC